MKTKPTKLTHYRTLRGNSLCGANTFRLTDDVDKVTCDKCVKHLKKIASQFPE